jgi:hypothetical protein
MLALLASLELAMKMQEVTEELTSTEESMPTEGRILTEENILTLEAINIGC